MEDILLNEFFNPDRWQKLSRSETAVDINEQQLYQLCLPETRARMYRAIRDGKYVIAPPHTALIPKDTPGEFRTVYINEPIDRILLSIANDIFFDFMPEMISDRCKSYQRG